MILAIETIIAAEIAATTSPYGTALDPDSSLQNRRISWLTIGSYTGWLCFCPPRAKWHNN
jgi:hypothetical protein